MLLVAVLIVPFMFVRLSDIWVATPPFWFATAMILLTRAILPVPGPLVSPEAR